MFSDEPDFDHSKVDPALTLIYDQYTHDRADAASTIANHPAIVFEDEHTDTAEALPGPAPVARVIVTLECSPDADFSDLVDTDITINPSEHRIRTGIVHLGDLPRLARHPAVIHVAAASELHPYLDLAAKAVHLTDFWSAYGIEGKGVIIGVIDSGLDAAHPAFAGRVLKIWDQNSEKSTNQKNTNVLYGMEYTGKEVSNSTDEHGHGTAVAGIAAGNEQQYRGAAPQASIVVVKAKFLNASVIDAIRYIFKIATDLKMPAVINLSLGGHDNPHDGSDPLSQMIDEASGPGRVICCAAGNQGDSAIHAQARIYKGKVTSIPFVHVASPGAEVFKISGWYSGDDALEVAVQLPQEEKGNKKPAFQPILRTPPEKTTVRTREVGGKVVKVSTPDRSSAGKLHQFTVYIKLPNGSKDRVEWLLLLRGGTMVGTSTRVDAWVTSNENGHFCGPQSSRSMTIGSPGCATEAITVGSYTTRTHWNQYKDNTGITLDDITPFSSQGPRRDGLHKPDLLAPGAWLIMSRSRQSHPDDKIVIDDKHVIGEGTSMASPFVAGIVALVLSQHPELAAQDILDVFGYTKTEKAQEAVNRWGRGLIDLSGL
ncbi:S8 family serine peptidase [Saccharothrix xinjiangensis]|uniref:S8 family serine peptidase n=1 Tax=Saccharothrix xinjiangensis TaxID=204798 RepID=A0ABV9XUZ8_9PSEU